jgi:hypothetical protein
VNNKGSPLFPTQCVVIAGGGSKDQLDNVSSVRSAVMRQTFQIGNCLLLFLWPRASRGQESVIDLQTVQVVPAEFRSVYVL